MKEITPVLGWLILFVVTLPALVIGAVTTLTYLIFD